jgi:hypothetical protein
MYPHRHSYRHRRKPLYPPVSPLALPQQASCCLVDLHLRISAVLLVFVSPKPRGPRRTRAVIASGAQRNRTDDSAIKNQNYLLEVQPQSARPTPATSPQRMKRRAAFSSARRFNSYSFVCTSYLSSVPGVPLLSALPLGRASFRLNNPSPSWIEELHPHRIAVAMQ